MCCGRRTPGNQYTIPSRISAVQARVSFGLPSGPMFEYTGATALTVTGPVTGARYRFNRRGSRLHVDPHDSAALARVPVLRSVG
jgi:hypothetical protein